MMIRSTDFDRHTATQRASSAGAVPGRIVGGRAAVPEAATAARCAEGLPDLLNALLFAEQVAMTMYFTALTTPAVVGHPYLAGTSANPNAVASNGNPVNVANMQAALDQERQHMQILQRLGARSPSTQVYFPAATFAGLGYTRSVGTFLWVVDHIETALIGGYLALIHVFGTHQQAGLVQLIARILGTEAQHRVLGRVVSGDTPANNLGLEVNSFTCSSEIQSYLQPYMTGAELVGSATPAIRLPSQAAMARVIGTHRSR